MKLPVFLDIGEVLTDNRKPVEKRRQKKSGFAVSLVLIQGRFLNYPFFRKKLLVHSTPQICVWIKLKNTNTQFLWKIRDVIVFTHKQKVFFLQIHIWSRNCAETIHFFQMWVSQSTKNFKIKQWLVLENKDSIINRTYRRTILPSIPISGHIIRWLLETCITETPFRY